ncbi:MAG: adenosylhomocysteinase [Pyrinomonadaceae bacterium]|nr:adenosylhomocysteinase [Pyrinomonadaceae bacterium]
MSKAASRIADSSLADEGRQRLEWTRTRMPILRSLKKTLEEERPFDEMKIAICLHVEPKTAVWLEALRAGGAEIFITGSPGTTDDATAAFLAEMSGVNVFAKREETFDDHIEYARSILEFDPDLISDNGADLHSLIHSDFKHLKTKLIGATEETTSGGYRLREEIESDSFPTIVINDSRAKRIIENRYGVGQSVVDSIMRSTNALIGGLRAAVIGYGYCGRGVALCLKNLGARVTVVDIDPLTRLDALLEGFNVAEKAEAISGADLVITVTGRDNTLQTEDFERLSDGAIVANAGHFEFEIDVDGLRNQARSESRLSEDIEKFSLASSKEIFLLGKGRPVNLSAGEGNPIEVMDLGLALQTLSFRFLVENGSSLRNGPQNVPDEVERMVSELAFEAWK